MKIQDKTLFGIGLTFQIVQFLIIGIGIISLLNWDWLNSKVILIVGGITFIILYNGVSIWLMRLGLIKETSEKKK